MTMSLVYFVRSSLSFFFYNTFMVVHKKTMLWVSRIFSNWGRRATGDVWFREIAIWLQMMFTFNFYVFGAVFFIVLCVGFSAEWKIAM